MKIKHLTGGVFIVFLCIAVVMALLSYNKTSFHFENIKKLVNGQSTSSYETSFDKNLNHRDASNSLWNAMGYKLHGEGKEGVLIGSDGWLFTNEEFVHGLNFEENIKQNKYYILSVLKQLSANKIKLVIVPIPSKARIYSENLGRYKFPQYWKNQYIDLIDFLEAHKLNNVDLLKTFNENKKENIFLKTDTHWTPLGARLTALKTEQLISLKFPYLSWETSEYKANKGALQSYEGDLMRYTVNGNMAQGLGLKKDQFYEWETVNTNQTESDLFDQKTPPITLVGTSYSANKLWNFEGFLKEMLAVDILNVADEGLGPFETMHNYLNSALYKQTPPKIIIWEMPERYLAIKNKFIKENE